MGIIYAKGSILKNFNLWIISLLCLLTLKHVQAAEPPFPYISPGIHLGYTFGQGYTWGGQVTVAVARECHHSQRAVDKYLKDYQRVITAHDSKPDVDFIHRVTGIAPHVIKQYLEIQKHGTSTTHK